MEEKRNELAVKEVEFNGVNLVACQREDGKVFVSLNMICRDLGVNERRQRDKILAHEVLSKGCTLMYIPTASGAQETYVLDIDFIPMWLMTVTPSRVDESVRPKLVEYQLKAKDVLSKAFINQITIDQLLLEDLTAKSAKFDILMNSNDMTDMLKFAHVLNIKNFGRTKLFGYLRGNKILMSNSNRRNVPYAKYSKYFAVVEGVNPKGEITYKTLVNTTGQNFILDMLIKDGKVTIENREKIKEELVKTE